MAHPSTELLDEAPDLTAAELHQRVLGRLWVALQYALTGRAVVFYDIFLRVEGRVQAAADLLIVPGITPGTRRVYRYPDEPLPSATIEVLSPRNRGRQGRALLESKRALFGMIAVPVHVEIDPDEGVITVWAPRDGGLTRVDVTTSYTAEAFGGVRVETPAPGVCHVLLPNGREVLDGGDEIARAERLAARAERLAAKLRDLGIDPDEPSRS